MVGKLASPGLLTAFLLAVSALGGEPESGAGAAAGESPFRVTAHAGIRSVRPGEELPVAVVLEIAAKHKVYDESVSVEIAPGAKGRVARLERPRAVWKFDPSTGQMIAAHVGRAVFRLALADVVPDFGELSRAEGAAPPEAVSVKLRVRFRGCIGKMCTPTQTREVELEVPVREEAEPAEAVNEELFTASPAATAAPSPEEGDFTARSPVLAVLAAFGLGLLLTLTPCVYPLVPVTVAVIGARSASGGWRKGLSLSLVYVLGLSVTYAVLGAVAAKGGSSVGAVSQHWAVVLGVAAVFLALAASLFGAYDLEMPSSWQARLRMRRAGGPVGVFLMGLLSGLVATPCVAAPLYAVLTFIWTTGSVFLGAAMLFAMAWGMGVLLILAGTFSGLTSRLPKAGAWMVRVKTALGVVIVLAALYFLRGALPALAFTAYVALPLLALGVWRGLVAGAAVDAPRAKRALKALGMTAFVFGLYFGAGALIRIGMPAPLVTGLYPDRIVPSPSKIAFRTDYAAALAEAAVAGRPVMLDFVLPNCPGCREIEHDVFSRDDVAAEAERFVRVRIDLDDPPPALGDAKEKFRVFGAPAVVWIDGEGNVRDDLTVADGGVSPEDFLRRMREVK